MAKNIGHLEAFLGLNTAGLTAGIARARATLQRAQQQMTAIGRTMTMTLSLPLVAIGGGAVKLAVDFEKSMSKIEGLVGIASEKVNAFKKDVLGLSGQTGKAPLELADALFFVTSAGFRGQDALDVLNASAKAAAAGLGETKVVADLVTSAVNAYGIENLNATQATDALVAAVREGKAEAPELAESLGQVLPIASALEVSFQQVGAAVASMTRTGTKSATAAIQLRQILASLLKPTQQAEEAMSKMGTSSALLRKKLREEGLISVLGFLREQMETNEQAMAQIFPNIRALSGALDIMGANAGENVAIFERMKDNTGDLDRAFAAAAKTASFKWNKALAELKVTGVKIGTQLLPVFLSLVDTIKQVAKWFGGLSENTRKAILVIGGLVAAIGPAIFIIGKLAGVLAVLSGPVGLAIAAIAALGVAVWYIYDNWEAIIERISDWSWWKNVLIDMAVFLIRNNPWAYIWKFWAWVIPKIIEGWNKLIDWITDVDWWKNMLIRMINLFVKYNPMTAMQNAVSWITGRVLPKLSEQVEETVDKVKDTGFQWDWGNPFESSAEGILALKNSTNAYEHQFKGFGESMRNGMEKIKKTMAGLFPTGAGAGAGAGAGDEPITKAVEGKQFNLGVAPSFDSFRNKANAVGAGMGLINRAIEKANESMKEGKKAVFELGTAMQNVLNTSLVSFAETLGNIFTGDAGASSFFGSLLLIVSGFMKTFGQALIAAGVASEAFKKLLINPFLAIGAGVALIALATVVKNIASKGPGGLQGLASGGYVVEGGAFQLHKNEIVSLPAGSAVTPARAANASGGGLLSTEINLRKLIIQLDREKQRMGR